MRTWMPPHLMEQFSSRVYGYFILSKLVGLLRSQKDSVLLNYGLDEARFIKPVYPGTTIGFVYSEEKLDQEKRP